MLPHRLIHKSAWEAVLTTPDKLPRKASHSLTDESYQTAVDVITVVARNHVRQLGDNHYNSY